MTPFQGSSYKTSRICLKNILHLTSKDSSLFLRKVFTLLESFPRSPLFFFLSSSFFLFFINLSTDVASSETTDISSLEASRRSTISCSLSNLRFITFNLPINSARGMASSSRKFSLFPPVLLAILGKRFPPSDSLLLPSQGQGMKFNFPGPFANGPPPLASTVINRIAPQGSHRYSRRGHNTIVLQSGWQGLKHQLTYLLGKAAPSLVQFSGEWPIYTWLSAKMCANGGSDFWLSIKSVSNLLSCCCFVCAFITGQYHSGNNMNSKSGAAGEILSFKSEKHHRLQPLNTDTLTVSTFDAFNHVHDESKHYPSHWFAQRRYRFTQCVSNRLSQSFGVGGSKISLDRTLRGLKCFMTSIRRQSREELTFSFVKTLLQSLWYVTASGANVLFYCQKSG